MQAPVDVLQGCKHRVGVGPVAARNAATSLVPTAAASAPS